MLDQYGGTLAPRHGTAPATASRDVGNSAYWQYGSPIGPTNQRIAPPSVTPRTSVPNTLAARTATPNYGVSTPWQDRIGSYNVGAAPQISNNPLSNVPGQYIPDFNAMAKQNVIPGVEFNAISGGAPMAGSADIMQYATGAFGMLDDAGAGRVAAARESEIARGMGRSGVAMGVENRVMFETELAKQAAYAEYATKQAELDQQVNLANQNAQLAWTQLQDASNQFKAQLAQERNLAQAEQRIQMAGLQTQWASKLADISFQREELNATMQQTQQQMLRSANEFDRNLSMSSYYENERATLGRMGLTEQARGANLDYDLGTAGLAVEARRNDALTQQGWADLALQGQQVNAASQPNWAEMANDGNQYFANYSEVGNEYGNTQLYLDAAYPGWRDNPALVQLFTQSVNQNPSNLRSQFGEQPSLIPTYR